MNRFFNIAGPCFPEEHYTLPPLERLPGLLPLIHQKQYFVIHAARQTGKTTLLQHLTTFLNQEGKYYAAYCPLEAAQVFPEPKEGIRQIFYTDMNGLMKAFQQFWRENSEIWEEKYEYKEAAPAEPPFTF